MTIKISVITVTFNSIKTIADTVNSLRMQNYQNKELIWIDGGSTDGTKEFLENSITSNQGIFISEPDFGIYHALNKGLKLSSGDVIGFLHSDDIFSDDNVLSTIADIFGSKLVDVIYGDLDYVERGNVNNIVRRWRSEKFTSNSLKRGWMPPHPTLYFRRHIYETVGEFNVNYKISADYDHVCRIFSIYGLTSFYISKVLIKMRVGGISNRSIKNIFLKLKEDFRVIKSNNSGGIFTLIQKNTSKIKQFWIKDYFF